MSFAISDKFFINSSIVLWVMFVITICIIVGQQGMVHTVTPNYFIGADLWMQGKILYDVTGRGFIYLPQAAALFVPFAYLAHFSFPAAEVVWRLISISLLLLAIWRFANLVEQKFVARTFFIVTAVTLPLIFSSARNGQFNNILEVMMLLAVTSIAQERWVQAVFYLVLGFALKPTMIVLLLLLWVLYRPLWWRLPLGLILAFIFPFFTQSPYYVGMQYLHSVDMLQTASVLGSNTIVWAQVFGLLAQLRVILPQIVQDIIRLLGAVVVLYCGFLVKQKFCKNHVVIFLYALASGYLMLFNPRTEGNDYGILAPAVGMFVSLFLVGNYKKQMWLLVLIVVGLIMSGGFTFIMSNDGCDFWSAPFFTLVFMMIVIKQIIAPPMFLQNKGQASL